MIEVSEMRVIHCTSCMMALIYVSEIDKQLVLRHPKVEYCEHSEKKFKAQTFQLEEAL